jgi:3-deoxy-D-manno-octulosonic-acid transferase
VVLAAVTREGEEQGLLSAWQAVAWLHERPLLLIVPRHPQRFDEVASLVRSAGFSVARRSAWRCAAADPPPAAARACDVWLGDSLGEMALYYGLADAALLGGSFAPLGGQNLIEALACGCPLVVGPHTFNFAEAAQGAIAAGAAERVESLPEAVVALQRWLTPGEAAEAAGLARRAEAGRRFAAAHRGAAQRMAEAVAEVWREPRRDAGSAAS